MKYSLSSETPDPRRTICAWKERRPRDLPARPAPHAQPGTLPAPPRASRYRCAHSLGSWAQCSGCVVHRNENGNYRRRICDTSFTKHRFCISHYPVLTWKWEDQDNLLGTTTFQNFKISPLPGHVQIFPPCFSIFPYSMLCPVIKQTVCFLGTLSQVRKSSSRIHPEKNKIKQKPAKT